MAAIKLVKALYLGCNVLETLKTLKAPKRRVRKAATTQDEASKGDAPSEPIRRISTVKREQLRSCLVVWIVWVTWDQVEHVSDHTIGYVVPFYGQIKIILLLYLTASRHVGASLVYNWLLLPQIFKPYSRTIDSIASLLSLVLELTFQVLLLVTVVPILSAWSRIKGLFLAAIFRTSSTSSPSNGRSSRKGSGPSGGASATPPRRRLPGSFSQQITDYALQTPRTLRKTVQVFRAPNAIAIQEAKKTGQPVPASSVESGVQPAISQAQTARQKRYDALAATAAAARPQLPATRGRARSSAMGPPSRPMAAPASRLNTRAESAAPRKSTAEPEQPAPRFPTVPVNPFIDTDSPAMADLQFPSAPRHDPTDRPSALVVPSTPLVEPAEPPVKTSHQVVRPAPTTTLALTPPAKRPKKFAAAMAVAPLDLSGSFGPSQTASMPERGAKPSLGKPVRPIKPGASSSKTGSRAATARESAPVADTPAILDTLEEVSLIKVSPQKRKRAVRGAKEAGPSGLAPPTEDESSAPPKRARVARAVTASTAAPSDQSAAAKPSGPRSAAPKAPKATAFGPAVRPKKRPVESTSSPLKTSKRRSGRNQKTS